MAYSPKFHIGARGASLFKKGLSENDVIGVIKRRNGCGSTTALKGIEI
jgi:hypothetical protein